VALRGWGKGAPNAIGWSFVITPRFGFGFCCAKHLLYRWPSDTTTANHRHLGTSGQLLLSSMQSPGDHQARHPSARTPRRRVTHLRLGLRGDEGRLESLPGERHLRCGHVRRARSPEDCHSHGCGACAQAERENAVRVRRVKSKKNARSARANSRLS